jgi:hypothetical protein
MANTKNTAPVKKSGKNTFIGIGVAIALIIVYFFLKGTAGAGDAAASGGDITISKSEITKTAKFIPYKAGKTKLEVIAIRASDGTVRTAFNTCQVCYDSGRGYYVQEGDELVCQNCGNRFKISQVEKIKGGCNPVPIVSENKSDDGTNITITQGFLEQNKGLFGKWKKG